MPTIPLRPALPTTACLWLMADSGIPGMGLQITLHYFGKEKQFTSWEAEVKHVQFLYF